MRRFSFLFITLGLLCSSAAAAERSLSFSEALAIALEQGAEVRRAKLSALTAEATSRTASMAWQPDLNLGLSSALGVDRENTDTSLNSSLQSSLGLWHGGEQRSLRRQADASARSARLSVEQARQDITWGLVSAWVNRDQANARLIVARASAELEATTLERVQAMVDAGARTSADAASQKASVAEAAAAVAQAEGTLALEELSLLRLLRLEVTENVQFQALEDQPAAQDEEARALIEEAFSGRSDLSALVAEEESARAGVELARAGRLPSLGLSAGLATGWSSGGGGAFSSQIGEGVGASLGLQLQVPLWDRGSTRGAVDRARASQEVAGLYLDEARQETTAEILSALERLRTARSVMDATVARLAASEEAEELTRQRFEAGASSLVELAQARSKLEDARQAEISARYDLLSLRWELGWATGSLDLQGVR